MLLDKELLLPIVNHALNEARDKAGVTSDEALAKRLFTSQKTISQLRNGHWTALDTAIISVLVSAMQPAPHAAQNS